LTAFAKVGIISGGFDPLHSGHIKYIQAAALECDILIVGVNSNDWLERKKGKYFLHFDERQCILEHVIGVQRVMSFDDSDDSAIDLINKVKAEYEGSSEVIFMNGGDRTKENIPEMSVDGVTFLFGVGGEDKTNSSSWILKNWEIT
tara:strand:- start:634 stop:1071 length:438 start_codon:yes stop_codon:yes gene_type:complete